MERDAAVAENSETIAMSHPKRSGTSMYVLPPFRRDFYFFGNERAAMKEETVKVHVTESGASIVVVLLKKRLDRIQVVLG
jgi:hypothetical protein